MRSLVEEEITSSESDMWRGDAITRASEAAADLWTAKDEAGANARAHGAEERRPARKRMERFIVE